MYWHVQDPWGTPQPLMRLHGGTRALYLAGSLYTGGLPDVAENVWVSDHRAEPRKQHPRIYDRLTVRKAGGRYDPDVLGVISSGAGLLLNSDPAALEHGKATTTGQQPLALAGRVPAKVSLENGPIAPGDRIVASSIPGVGMRASQPGMSIGIAAETFDAHQGDEPGTILVFVNLAPTAPATRLRGQSGLDDSGATRGQARLRHGEAVIALPEALVRRVRTGQAVVQLTPLAAWSPLFVAESSRRDAVVVRTTSAGDPGQGFFWEVKAVDAEAPILAFDDRRGRR
jgi:hypothetical protein